MQAIGYDNLSEKSYQHPLYGVINMQKSY